MTKTQGWILIGFIAIILAGGTLLLWQNFDNSTNTGGITIYPVQCSNPNVTNFSNCTSPIALGQNEYYLDKTNQTVTIGYPSEANSTLGHGADCTIVDSSNWSCGSDDPPPLGGFGFKNGNYFSGGWSTNSGQWSIIYVSQRQWNSINHGQDGPI